MQTLSSPSPWTEQRVRGSGFIARAEPAADRNAVDLLLQAGRVAYPGASHYCFAYRLFEAERGPLAEYASDAGEPSGSAGAPLLRVLRRRDLVNVVLVAVRYFGGTKLGIRGLIEAYGTVGDATLAEAACEDWVPMRRWLLEVPYPLVDRVQGAVRKLGGKVIEQRFEALAELRVEVPQEQAPAFQADLEEWIAGGVVIRPERTWRT